MKETITLKLNQKAVRGSNAVSWITIPIVFIGACSILYRTFTSNDSPAEAIIARFLGLGLFLIIIWIIKLLWSQIDEHNRQLRDDIALYELTSDGISNHYGNFQRWNDFKKIYFYKGSVHFSYVNKPSNAFVMSSTGIDAGEFREACRFVKAHAPASATKKFKP